MIKLSSKKMIPAALLAALTAVLSQIAIPLPFTPVPLNLATLAVLLSGGLLGAKYGFISQTVYVCLGLAGFPVFAEFTGGPGIVAGPTGGYIVGYLLTAALSGFLIERLRKGRRSTSGRAASWSTVNSTAAACAFAAGILACYVPGTLWFMAYTGSGLAPSLAMCVLPFLPGDALKIAAAVLLTRRLRPILTLI